MPEETYLEFLANSVQFIQITDEITPPIDPNLLESLMAPPKKEILLLIWSDIVDGDLIDKINTIPSKHVAIIVKEKSPSLRRAEMLLNTTIRTIYSCQNRKISAEDLYQVCISSVSAPRQGKSGKGIKRVLKLTETEQANEYSPFICLYSDGVLIEYAGNATIAALQLKGKRASALYMGSMTPNYLQDLEKMIPDELGNQVLMNQYHLSSEIREQIAKFSKKFKVIDTPNQDELIHSCSMMDLPTLHKQVWKNPDAMVNSKINLILKSQDFVERFIAIQGFDNQKSAPDLDLEQARNVVESTDPSRRPKLLAYKKEVIHKPYILLNCRARGVQEELLRLLYCVSQIPQVIVAIGDRPQFKFLAETASEYESNPYYAHRSVHIVYSDIKRLPVLLKDLLHSAQFLEEEEEDLITIEVKDSFRMAQMAIDYMIGQIQSQFPKLVQEIDLKSEKSGKLIFDNLMRRHQGVHDPVLIFKNEAERKALHQFLTRITPDASKTAFPNNVDDLVVTIQSIQYLILQKPKQKLGSNEGVIEFIRTNKLQLTPLSSYVKDIENLMIRLKKETGPFPSSELEKRKVKVLESLQHIDFIIRQIQLQFAFLTLASDDPAAFMEFEPETINDPEQSANRSPLMEIQALKKEIENYSDTKPKESIK